MRKRILYLSLFLGLNITMLGACDKNNDSASNQPTTEAATPSEGVQLYEFDYEHIYDGINRIAVTFYEDCNTKIGLSWYTPDKENFGVDIEVIEKNTSAPVNVKYEVDSGQAEYDDESMYHQAVISGLSPETDYYYRIGDSEENKWSGYGTFKTASDNIEEYKFVAVTDTQSEHLPDAYFATDTMKTALEVANDSAFIIHSGDFVDNGNHEEMWKAQMDSSKDILMNNVIVPAVGNHEEEKHAFWQHFSLPHTNGHKTTGLYYSFDYGKTHIVVLDTNKTNEAGTSYIDDEQLEWLETDLKQANENGARWIIVNMHKGLYTVGEHADNEKFEGDTGARSRVGKVFEEYGVDLVLQGHDHCPSVTKPIIQGKVSDGGVIYVNTGSAGSKSYSMAEEVLSEEYMALFEYTVSEERQNDTYQNFAVISVTEEQIKVTMYEKNLMGQEDELYILKEFEIKN